MAKIIKQAKAKKTFKINDVVCWVIDGSRRYGNVVKVCPVNLHVEDVMGRIWSVSKKEAK